jgi:hypothetical protein
MNCLVNVPQEEDFDKEWENIRTAIKDTATETIGIQEKAVRNEWWDEYRRRIIEGKNKAWKRALRIKTRLSQELYNSKRLETNKVCKEKKKKMAKRKNHAGRR